jgi:cell division ATPase FtsA
MFSEELEKIDQDIPVEVETAPYLLSQEEEKQLEKLLNKKKNADFIMQTFTQSRLNVCLIYLNETGGGSNLKNLRQLANYVTGFDARIGFANEYIANDKNQYLKSPEFATSIGLLMESLKIHDKKPVEKPGRCY